MSVVPVREAIRQLEAEGFVTFEHNVGRTGRDGRRGAVPRQHDGPEHPGRRRDRPGRAPTHRPDLQRPEPINERCSPPSITSTTACSPDPQPGIPLGVVHQVRQRPHGAPWCRPSGPGWPPARSSTFSFVPRPRPRIGLRARTHRRPHRSRRTAVGDRRAARRHRTATLDAYLATNIPTATSFGLPAIEPCIGATMTDTSTLAARHVPADLPNRIRHYIGGAFVDRVDGETFDVLDPVSQRDLRHGRCRQEGRHRPRRRRRARAPSARGRGRGCCRANAPASCTAIADIVESRDARLAELEAFDTGLPITQALGQARAGGRELPLLRRRDRRPGRGHLVPAKPTRLRDPQPIGVAGLITPWNTPFMLEPGSSRPRSQPAARSCSSPPSWRRCRRDCVPGIMEEAGLPPGVFNLVNGLGEDAGDALVTHPDVPSSRSPARARTGKLIFGNAAPILKGLSMELGGKSPCIVFADADLEPPSTRAVRRLLAQRRALHRRLSACSSSARSTTSSSTASPSGPRRSASATRPTRRPRSARSITPSTTSG